MPSCLEPRPKPRTTWPRQKNGRLLMTLTSEDAGCSSLGACDGAAVSAAPGPGPAGDPAGAGPAEQDSRRYQCLPAGQLPGARTQRPLGRNCDNRGERTDLRPRRPAYSASVAPPGSPAPAAAAPPRGRAPLSVVVRTILVLSPTPAVEAPPLPLWPRPHPWPSLQLLSFQLFSLSFAEISIAHKINCFVLFSSTILNKILPRLCSHFLFPYLYVTLRMFS